MRPLEDWDEVYLLEVASGQGETEYFEKKGSGLLQRSKGEILAEIAKGVCAFANSGDGFFVIGIDKASGLDAGISETYGKQTIKEWAEQIIPTLLQPPINNCIARFLRHSQHHAAGAGVLAIFVPLSHHRPHWSKESGTREIAYIRAGEHSLPMRIQTLLDISSRAEARIPELHISLFPGPPDCQKTQILIQESTQAPVHGEMRVQPAVFADAYYFRLRIENQSSEAARDVEVFISDLRGLKGGEYVPIPDFLPQNLLWSHVGGTFYKLIAPGMSKWCDLGRVVDPPMRHQFMGPSENPPALLRTEAGLSLAVEGQMFLGDHVLVAGRYEAIISVAAANGQEPKRRKLKMHVTGQWSPIQDAMLSQHVSISLE